MEQNQVHKRQLIGIIVSHKMNKTAVVKVDKTKLHPKYKKRYIISKKFKAHDEKNEYKERDVVVIEECRPMSREKRWRIIEKMSRL